MAQPRVFNKYHGDAPPGAVYIGRGSRAGNPFVIGKDGDRAEVIEKYRAYVEENEELKAWIKRELRGKDVICFCKPKDCHGDIVVEVANS